MEDKPFHGAIWWPNATVESVRNPERYDSSAKWRDEKSYILAISPPRRCCLFLLTNHPIHLKFNLIASLISPIWQQPRMDYSPTWGAIYQCIWWFVEQFKGCCAPFFDHRWMWTWYSCGLSPRSPHYFLYDHGHHQSRALPAGDKKTLQVSLQKYPRDESICWKKSWGLVAAAVIIISIIMMIILRRRFASTLIRRMNRLPTCSVTIIVVYY